MTAKVIGVYYYLTLSCLFLCVLGEMQITPEQFANFKGSDPTTNCGCDQKMQNFCNEIMKKVKDPKATGNFMRGYPLCQSITVKGKQNCGGGSVDITTYAIVCAWAQEVAVNNLYYVFGKGQTQNHLMSYTVDDDGNCHFDKEYQY